MLRALLTLASPKNPSKSPPIIYSPFSRQIATAAKNAAQRARQQTAPLQMSTSYPASNPNSLQHHRLFDGNNPNNIAYWIKKYFNRSNIDIESMRIARTRLGNSIYYGFERDVLFQRNVVLFSQDSVKHPKFNALASGRTAGQLIPINPAILCWQATLPSGFIIRLGPHLNFTPGKKLKQQPDEKSGIRLKNK